MRPERMCTFKKRTLIHAGKIRNSGWQLALPLHRQRMRAEAAISNEDLRCVQPMEDQVFTRESVMDIVMEKMANWKSRRTRRR